MIWEQLTEAKINRKIKLLNCLKQQPMRVKQFAEEIGVSTKTVRRDLAELEKTKGHFFTKGVIVWENAEVYHQLYFDLLQESEAFNVFRHFLWKHPIPYKRGTYRHLNEKLLKLNLSLTKEGLIGNDAVLFQLRWQYLLDFEVGNQKHVIEEKMFRFYQFIDAGHLDFALGWEYFVASPDHFNQFLARSLMPETVAYLLYFEEQKRYYDLFLSFYLQHQEVESILYRDARLCSYMLIKYLKIDDPRVQARLQLKLFRLLLDLSQGFPIGFINQLADFSSSPKLWRISKKMKELVVVLDNCPVTDLAYTLEKTVRDAYLCSFYVERYSTFSNDDFHNHFWQEEVMKEIEAKFLAT
ncbi:DeoR family transcriptional regulator [Enterococcus alishanensis]|uniref:DeoR family transcriptional regulator n=1 Tax=Enterococcus alishanensis TaxID=1303817 RepID=A0ABS6T8T2_9ENTE|nr:DeoR family transcriptional regulator [Enterococcus alishanensis]MBV7389312.1 DeoR family transcriptional regulator [Enterococcus alishanensis]